MQKKLKMALWEAGRTQKEVALLIGKHPSNFTKMMKGKRQIHEADKQAIATYLGRTAADLF